MFITLGLVCFGGLFYLPDNFNANSVYKVYHHLKRNSPDMFIPAPPISHGNSEQIDLHKLDDKAKFDEKIRQEFGGILEKPDLRNPAPPAPNADILPKPDIRTESTVRSQSSKLTYSIDNSEDRDPDVRKKRDKVKEVCVIQKILSVINY